MATDAARRGLALLRMAVGDDPVSLRVILGLGDATARSAAYRRLTDYCRDENKTEHEVLEALRQGERLPIRVPAFVQRFSAAMAFLETLPRDDLAGAVDQLFPPDVDEVKDIRAFALEELVEADDLADLCKRVVIRVTQHDVPESPDYVRIMSLHKSKGLTSPTVYMAGMVDGIVPTIPSHLSEAAREAARHEQRRLAYVAVTRASEELVISSSAQMDLGMASALGVKVVRERIRRVSGQLVAPTIASPYVGEMAGAAPTVVRGVDWLRANTP